MRLDLIQVRLLATGHSADRNPELRCLWRRGVSQWCDLRERG
jgi:hypothetical protein